MLLLLILLGLAGALNGQYPIFAEYASITEEKQSSSMDDSQEELVLLETKDQDVTEQRSKRMIENDRFRKELLNDAQKYQPVIEKFEEREEKTINDTDSLQLDTLTSPDIGTSTTESNSTISENAEEPWFKFRLPGAILPKLYELTIYPQFLDKYPKKRFLGNLIIHVDVMQETQYIILHSWQLTIAESHVYDVRSGELLEIVESFSYAKNKYWVLKTKDVIASGSELELSFRYYGFLLHARFGMYLTSVGEAGSSNERLVVATQFQSTFARTALPCFDEPHLKARFAVTILHPRGYTALSNMPPIMSEALSDELVSTSFATTPMMSTYTLCMVICYYDVISTHTRRNITVQLWAESTVIKQTHSSLFFAQKSLDFFENLFNMTYPLPKLDLVDIPSQNVMENWGLVVFNEMGSRHVPNNDKGRKLSALITAHEVAHMWFGNLVTMRWWSDLWLNEALATFMSRMAMTALDDSFKTKSLEEVEIYRRTMITDNMKEGHTLVTPVATDDEIFSMFSEISYRKGASVMYMLQAYLGYNNIIEGLKLYLHRHQYQNTDTADLWQAFSEVSGKNVGVVMDTWIYQVGFPLVNVTYDISRNSTTIVTVTQSLFSQTPLDYPPSPYEYTWFIPLQYVTSLNPQSVKTVLMNRTSATFAVDIDLSVPDTWIYFNPGCTGYYRVLYPEAMWGCLVRAFISSPATVFTKADKLCLFSDASFLIPSGHVSTAVGLDVTRILYQEESFILWNWLTEWLAKSETGRLLKTMSEFGDYFNSKVTAMLNNIGWTGTDSECFERVVLRLPLKKVMATDRRSLCQDSDVMRYQEGFSALVNTSLPLEAADKCYLMMGCLEECTVSDWFSLHDQLILGGNATWASLGHLMAGLRYTSYSPLIQSLLDKIENGSLPDRSNNTQLLYMLEGNVNMGELVFDWMHDNWLSLQRRFDPEEITRFSVKKMLQFNTMEEYEEAADFIQKMEKVTGENLAYSLALNTIKKNMAWKERNYDAIMEVISRDKNVTSHVITSSC